MGPSIEEQRDRIRKQKSKEHREKIKKAYKKGIFKVEDFLIKGIYFLYHEGKIVYIGKSNDNVLRRVCDHYSDKSKKFDTFDFRLYHVSNKGLDRIEASLIKTIKPKYNIVHNSYKRKPKKPKIIYGRSRQ